MEFHIDGRFLADVRFENNAWTVHTVQSVLHARPPHTRFLAGVMEDDIGSFLDAIFLEAGQEPRSS